MQSMNSSAAGNNNISLPLMMPMNVNPHLQYQQQYHPSTGAFNPPPYPPIPIPYSDQQTMLPTDGQTVDLTTIQLQPGDDMSTNSQSLH